LKKIIVKDCLECPLIEKCKEFKSLSAKARFAMKTSPACSGILKTCKLEDDNAPQKKEGYDPLEYFEFFWNSYNKKIDLKKCKAKFSKLKKSDVDKILETVKSYVLANKDREFRKNPLTYLNGECWNDEIVFLTKPVSNNIMDQNKAACQEFINGD
jgi:hypothetical protein